MPAPVISTVDSASLFVLSRREAEGGAVRNFVSAAMAPRVVFAFRGIIWGDGKGPVYGMRRRGFFICELGGMGKKG